MTIESLLRKYRIIILLVSFSILISCGDDDDDNNDEPAEPTSEFEIEYPDSWEISENPSPLVLIAGFSPIESSADDFVESLNLVRESAPGLNLDTYVEASKTALGIFQDFEIISEGDIEINSRQGYEIIYRINFDGVVLQSLVHIYYENDNGYVLTAAATEGSFDRFESLFRTILETFRLN